MKDGALTPDQMVALKKKQFELALKGDVKMLIWLGKQYLGQTESPMVITEQLNEGFDIRVLDSNGNVMDDPYEVFDDEKEKTVERVDS